MGRGLGSDRSRSLLIVRLIETETVGVWSALLEIVRVLTPAAIRPLNKQAAAICLRL
jgi:hypothetical protein